MHFCPCMSTTNTGTVSFTCHLHRITPKLAMRKCPLMGIKYSIKSQLCNDKGSRHEVYIKCHQRRRPSQQNDEKLRISSFQQLSYADPMPSVQSCSFLHNQIYCHLYHLVCCSQDFVKFQFFLPDFYVCIPWKISKIGRFNEVFYFWWAWSSRNVDAQYVVSSWHGNS